MSAKYPRTAHLPWSPGGTNDDRRLKSVDHFLGQSLVVTEKLDGSNLCMTSEAIFARSHSGPPSHPSFDPAKAVWASGRHLLVENHSYFGEWCFAVHSIEYETLPSYFHLFGIRDDTLGRWLSWDAVDFLAREPGFSTVPVLAKLLANTSKELQDPIEKLAQEPSVYGPTREGIVVRVAREFGDDQFSLQCAKWVRANHVQTDDHWKHQEIRKQGLKT